ncbi:MAG: argininosuccinate lyase [Candidatus Omnitrophica bacterium]|nr:argininosuccinate lyase [Candidatus Omnitrophota bacterium]MDD5488106.1 argininosuccinate lyase [Candidatus Omnitrophota bacterium]
MAAKLWGGRFTGKEMNPDVLGFTSSLGVDRVLALYDCVSSKVHVDMLEKAGILSKAEHEELISVLDGLFNEVKEGNFDPADSEDIHSAIQGYIEKKAPEASKKLHTGRSRNEQIVNDVRLYLRDSAVRIEDAIKELQVSFVLMAERSGDVILPGYTHLNRAQPILLSHLVLAYVEMLERDKGRVVDAFKRSDMCVMGSGALAGSALNLDRDFVSEKLGYGKVSDNSLDSVSDRDFIAEFIAALSIISVHLSRFAEDMILYSIPEFGFVEIGADYCTGSSLMPQKRNPDVLELIRGKSAQVISALNSILVLMKGLPHTYNRDLQEDKKPLFESVETVVSSLSMFRGLAETIKVNKEAMVRALDNEAIYATDIAEYLVGKKVPFREAHDIVGKMVRYCLDKGTEISGLSPEELKSFSVELDGNVLALLDPHTSVSNKKTYGSTNPERVRKEVARWKKKLRG